MAGGTHHSNDGHRVVILLGFDNACASAGVHHDVVILLGLNNARASASASVHHDVVILLGLDNARASASASVHHDVVILLGLDNARASASAGVRPCRQCAQHVQQVIVAEAIEVDWLSHAHRAAIVAPNPRRLREPVAVRQRARALSQQTPEPARGRDFTRGGQLDGVALCHQRHARQLQAGDDGCQHFGERYQGPAPLPPNTHGVPGREGQVNHHRGVVAGVRKDRRGVRRAVRGDLSHDETNATILVHVVQQLANHPQHVDDMLTQAAAAVWVDIIG